MFSVLQTCRLFSHILAKTSGIVHCNTTTSNALPPSFIAIMGLPSIFVGGKPVHRKAISSQTFLDIYPQPRLICSLIIALSCLLFLGESFQGKSCHFAEMFAFISVGNIYNESYTKQPTVCYNSLDNFCNTMIGYKEKKKITKKIHIVKSYRIL